MEITGLQIVSIVFSVVMLYFVYVGHKKDYFGRLPMFIWMLIFLAIIFASVLPSIFTPIAEVLTIVRVFDFFVAIGLFFLVSVTFLNFIHLHKLKKKISKFTQDKALED